MILGTNQSPTGSTKQLKSKGTAIAVAAAVLVLAGAKPVGAASLYSIVDLGLLPNTTVMQGISVNEIGHVTGQADGGGGAFVYDGASLSDLGTLGGGDASGRGINDTDHVTGLSKLSNGQTRAFLHDGSTMNDLGTLGGNHSEGRGINNSGHVVGLSATSGGGSPTHAFFYDGSSMTDLGTLGGNESLATGINESGQITGRSDIAGGQKRAFLHQSGVMTNLGTLSGHDYSEGTDINSSGQISGSSRIDGNTISSRGIFYDGTTMIDLGTTDGEFSFAEGLNDNGQVVGFEHTVAGDNRAFIWESATEIMIALDDLIDPTDPLFGLMQLLVAQDINNIGQITGFGMINGQTHAFLLTETAPVPIPGALPLFLSSLGLMGIFGWRRRRAIP